MKFIFTLTLFLWLCQIGYAQDFSVVNLESSLMITHQKTVSSTFYVKNYTNENQSYQLFLKGPYAQGGSVALICYKGECSEVNLEINIRPNEVSSEIEIQFTGGLSSFKSTLQVEVIDSKSLNTSTRDVFIEVTDRNQEDIFYSKDEVIVSNFYPNPSVKFANMEYKLQPYQSNAKIILQNVLGSQVKEYTLDPRENKLRLLTENLSPGIYFYTLFINDEGLATRKLIVKR